MTQNRLWSLLLIGFIAAFVVMMGSSTSVVFAQSCGPNVTHVVQPGENLFRISLNHGTNYAAVAAANGIGDVTRIYPGQVIVMVCGSAGSATSSAGAVVVPSTNVLVPAAPPPPQQFAVPLFPSSVDCTNFRATHPRDGFTDQTQDFYWEAAPGATSYRVVVFNADLRPGTLVAAQDIPGPLTSTTVAFGPGYIGPGFRFSYRIQALVADSVVCSTPLLTLYRSVTQAPPVVAPAVP